MSASDFAVVPRLQPHVTLVSYEMPTEKKTYVQTTELDICGKIANIVFEALDQLPSHIEEEFNKVSASQMQRRARGVYVLKSCDGFDQSYPGVTRVLINFHIPLSGPFREVKSPYAAWTAFIPVMGSIFKEKFPNLKARESCFNIHFHHYHYREELQLYADVSPEVLSLVPY